jgi:hypothetical protein
MEGSGIPGGDEFNPHGSSGIYNSNGHHRTKKEDETCNEECAASPRSLHPSLSLRQIEEDWLRLTWLVTWSNKLRTVDTIQIIRPFLFAFFSSASGGVWRSQLGLAAKGGAQLEGVLLGLACSLASCGRQQSKRWSQWDISAFRWW